MIFRMLIKHLPNILTVAAGVGVVATAKLAIDAHDKCVVDKVALLDIHDKTDREEAVKAVKRQAVKHYIPPVAVGLATIGCITGIRVIDIKSNKNLLAAAMCGETMLQKYETRINEEFGPEKGAEIRKDVVGELAAGLTEDIHQSYSGPQQRMNCYDPYSDTFFKASQTELLLAEAEINKCIANGGGMSIVDYINYFGIDISKQYPEDPKEIPGWYCDDDFNWNASFFGNYVALCPMISEIRGHGETLIINVSHDPILPSEDFF